MIDTEREATEAAEAGDSLTIDLWYDRSVRSFRTMIVNQHGEQIGTANFDGTRADREQSVRWLTNVITRAMSAAGRTR